MARRDHKDEDLARVSLLIRAHAGCHGIHSSQMSTIGQTLVDPTGLQNGMIGGRQVDAYQVRKRQRGVVLGMCSG